MIEFPRLSTDQLVAVTDTIDEQTFETAQRIVDDVSEKRESALRLYGEKFDQLSKDSDLLVSHTEFKRALSRIDAGTRSLLERVGQRIADFAQAQRDSFNDLSVPIVGGTAGHRWLPLLSAGCYAPGGRYPLPSSVLMTATTARVAGVKEVWVASPNPNDVTLAAAAIAGATGVLRVGGAQAIAALAFGVGGVPACDVIVGPGNRFVTAAKAIVSKQTRIDSLAGPSELVVVAGEDAEPAFVAADLLAQAEHDPDARPVLVALSAELVESVKRELAEQLSTLPTAEVAVQALRSGGFIEVENIERAIDCCRSIAPEHLSLQGETVSREFERFEFGAALFVGSSTAEVFGDYGAGPNHVLPTGGAARSQSALSVLNFMRFQTVLNIENIDDAKPILADAAQLGRLEGLEAHARSSDRRCQNVRSS